MTERKLILVKHSLPEIVANVPSNAWHLSEAGKARCESLVNQLKSYAPRAIITSIEPKAVETGEIVASRLDKSVEIIDGLHEHDRTDVGWSSEDEFKARVAELFRKPGEPVYGRESADQAHARFKDAVANVLGKYPDGNIVIVSHGTVIALYVSRLAGLEPFSFWKRLGMPSFVVLSLPKLEVETIVEAI